ncbi:hypothetical protein L6164_006841 [Bauhinia variegata]|uniref:Uncharacterized protein n=1 Tax=Bauhinia variegata TaxID=167791 RepID=A0ACB9PW78_BAUVA|nr:hypothetical protein L6164_006841 [Bauhinia variegata]
MSEAETITEERTEFMVSPIGDSKPTSRPAHFLKPSITSIDGPVSEIPPSSSLPRIFDPKKWPLAVQFNGWRCPPRKWTYWVHSLHSIYESAWKKVGIYDAIMSSKCEIWKNVELVVGVAERWCSVTNTFIFPWGEATLTLEDMMILGGYPVLGASVLSPLESQELKETEMKLLLARMEAGRSKSRKACVTAWLNLFIDSGSDIEHEAFLVAWLSIFVFPNNNLVNKVIFPIAILLARGNPIALATAVLASIYEDLRLLKQAISALPNSIQSLDDDDDDDDDAFLLVLRSPLYLVQIWVWERIEALRPNPRVTDYGDPLLAKWEKVRSLKVNNVRLAIDSAGEGFLWRPYAKLASKRHFPLFYAENEMWVSLDADSLDKKLESFVMCLRVSELVGVDCINQYLPHRVAMQFGMDQDLPGCVPRLDETSEIAWGNYSRPITCKRLYIPARLFEADVTTRYAEWRKQSVLSHKVSVRGKRTPRHVPRASKANRSDDDADIAPAFPSKRSNNVILEDACGSKAKTGHGASPEGFKTLTSIYSVEECSKAKSDNVADVPPGFPPKHSIMSSANSAKSCEPTVLKEVYSLKEGSKSLAMADNNVDVPPGFPSKYNTVSYAKADKNAGFPPKHNTISYGNSVKECKPTILKEVDSVEKGSIAAKADNNADVPPGFPPKQNTRSYGNSVMECEPTILEEVNSVEKVSIARADNNTEVPPGFHPKHNIMSYGNSVKECEPTILKEIRGGGSSYSLLKVTTDKHKHLSNQSSSSSASPTDYDTIKRMDPLMNPVAKVEIETSMEGLHQDMNDAKENKESYPASPTEGKERISRLKRKRYTSEADIEQLEERIRSLEKLYDSLKY